jgi:hypothetical protein
MFSGRSTSLISDAAHLDTPRLRHVVDDLLDLGVEVVPLGEDFVQVRFRQDRAQGRLTYLRGREHIVLHFHHRFDGLDHLEVDDRVNLHRDVVLGDDVLGRNIEGHDLEVGLYHSVHDRDEQEQSRTLGADHTPEPEDHAPLVLSDDPHRRSDHEQHKEECDWGYD